MSLMFSLTAKLLGHQSSICEHNPPQECETQIASNAAVMGTLYVNLDQNQNMKLDLIFFSKASVQWIKYLVGYDGMDMSFSSDTLLFTGKPRSFMTPSVKKRKLQSNSLKHSGAQQSEQEKPRKTKAVHGLRCWTAGRIRRWSECC